MSLRNFWDLFLESDIGTHARNDGELPLEMSTVVSWALAKNVIVCNKRVYAALPKSVCLGQTEAAGQSWDEQCLAAQCREGLREILTLCTCPGAIVWQNIVECLFYHAVLRYGRWAKLWWCRQERILEVQVSLSLLYRWKSSRWSCYALAVETEPGRSWLMVLNSLHSLLL